MSELDLVFRNERDEPPTKLVLSRTQIGHAGVWLCFAHYGDGAVNGSRFLFRNNDEKTARSIAHVLGEKLAVPVVDAMANGK